MMFGRLLWKLLRSNRGRLAVALVAVISGATVISALLNVQFDISRKLSQEFSSLGPNLLIAPPGATQSQGSGAASAPLMDQATVADTVAHARAGTVVMSAPYLYIVARVAGTPVVVAGTRIDEAGLLNPTWKFDPGASFFPSPDERRMGANECYVGRNAARQLGLTPGSSLDLKFLDRAAPLKVSAVLDSGGPEDNQILADLSVVQALAGIDGKIQFEQLRVYGSAPEISAYAARLSSALPGLDVRPIRAVTEAEGNLLNRTRLLIRSMIALILLLTAFCVLATMAALAMERREDVGLMKALGGTISRIVALFLAELTVLGAAGGLIGCVAGLALAQWMGRRVFDASIAPRWEIFPLTIAMMVAVAMAGALPLRRLGRVKPAVILRGE